MVIEDERHFQSLEERLYFMEEAERQEFLRRHQDMQAAAEPVTEETSLAKALEQARLRLINAMDQEEHRRLASNLMEHVWNFFKT
jgi:DNA-binding IclR family transcriptional regulator